MATYTDSFDRADSGANAGWGTNWVCYREDVQSNTLFQILSNLARVESSFTNRGALWNGGSVGADQYSKAKVAALSGDGTAYVGVRMTNAYNGYFGGWLDSTTVRVVKIVAGSSTTLGTTGATYSASSVIEMRVSGTNPGSVSLYVDDSLVLGPYSDSDIDSGQPGVFVTNTGDFNDWGGGDLSASTVKKLKLLVSSAAASATSVEGVVFYKPASGKITGDKIGEFSGASFDATLTAGQAKLRVTAADFSGDSLGLTASPVAIVRNATYSTSIIQGNIFEETA